MPDTQFTDPLNGVELSPEQQCKDFRWPRRWWLHLLLLTLTLLTTTVFGYALSQGFVSAQPLRLDWLAEGYVRMAHFDPQVWTGLSFSGPLLLILLAHEFGHYLACYYWRVDASLPYFLPAPTLLGTLGAFIRIRSPIYTRKTLFDIGISGPLAGFAVLLPFLGVGMGLSRVAPGIAARGSFTFGTPLMIGIAEWVRFGHIPHANINLHPVAMAAWAGLLATAINLLPVGQLDGGHILYAALGERWHRALSLVFVLVLAVLGFFYWAWWIWAVLMFFGRRHPLIYDQRPLYGARRAVSMLALPLLALSLSVVPVSIK